MKVKISVKKLFNMEQFYLRRIKENERQYRGEVKGWRQENEYLKKTIRALDDQCEALKLEVEDLKKLFEDKVNSHLQQLAEINELKKDRKDWEDAARSAADNL